MTFRLFEVDGNGNETEVATVALLDGALCRAVIVPYTQGPLGARMLAPGHYRAQFTINRPRFRAASADTDDHFRQDLSVTLQL